MERGKVGGHSFSRRGKSKTAVILLGLLYVCKISLSIAQPLPPGGIDLLDNRKLGIVTLDREPWGTFTCVDSSRVKGWVLRAETKMQPEFIYHLGVNLPLQTRALEAGELLLLSFEAKTISASLETGEARTRWLLNVSANNRDRIEKVFSISSEWTNYHATFLLKADVNASDLALILQFGYPPQEFLIRSLSLIRYPKETEPNDLPNTAYKYQGMEPEAPWRAAADKRIREIRMGDFELHFFHKGKPLKNKRVEVELQRHHFGWGAAVSAEALLAEPERLEHFSNTFNLAVFENDLKIKAWSNPGRRLKTLEAISLLQEKGIDLKGHVLIWPGLRYLTPEFSRYRDHPEKINQMMAGHLDDILHATRGKISHWDVVNEAYTNKDLQQITGSEDILLMGFHKLREKSPEAAAFVNEFGIISQGGLDEAKQRGYFDFIQRMDEGCGGQIKGIGIQSHMGSDLTPPQKVFDILNFFAQLNKKISISEFTMAVDDPELRTRYTADFMRIAFSHPSVSEFLFWGYQSEKADIFTKDGLPGTMGKAFFEMVHGAWKTHFTEATNDKGILHERGFWGQYTYTLVEGDKEYSGVFELLPDGKKIIRIDI